MKQFNKKDLLLFFEKHQKEYNKFFNIMNVDLSCLRKYTKQKLNYLYEQLQYYFLLKEIIKR